MNPSDNDIELLRKALRNIRQELGEVREENTRLRAALANSELPCVYCTLPAGEIAKCASGFPGCARADDATGCPHLGAGYILELTRKRLREILEGNLNPPMTDEQALEGQ
jgi:hypothetical protein